MSRSFLVDSLITPQSPPLSSPSPQRSGPFGSLNKSLTMLGTSKSLGGPCPLGTHPDPLSLYSCKACIPFAPFIPLTGISGVTPPTPAQQQAVLRPVPVSLPLYPPFLLPGSGISSVGMTGQRPALRNPPPLHQQSMGRCPTAPSPPSAEALGQHQRCSSPPQTPSSG